MWKQKIGISLDKEYPIPTAQAIQIIAKQGFDAVSLLWRPELDLTPIVAAAREAGLALQSLHAPFKHTAKVWSKDPEISRPAVEELLTALADCHRFGIPTMVLHTWIGFDYTDTPTEEGLNNFGRIVEKAKEYGISLAFENTEGEEFLYALLERFSGEAHVGFCWDSGHEQCYNRGDDLLAKLGNRLLMTHLNDNLGISRFDGRIHCNDDLHLLPYDGIIDWDDAIARLKKARKQEILNFELGRTSGYGRHENDCYAQMPLEQYFAEAYKRACRIASRYCRD
jgi:sugar phosphate isomerase/epimerase